ncbi:hypothetical protein BB559_001790 [Furculomyces boomerangus]|uniref:Uncharacterized protein n=1 Tax=Furculomyces boomerangus TaxID=61424 RepID=A0A2T9Z0H8_9FUNG|nr:hypothetical protein BB559_001790 [Furculomyces boomerangus]
MSLRLYWPKNSLNENEGGFLVGWFVGKSDLVVATIVKFQDAILLKKAAPALNQQKAYNPRVVGILCGSKYGSLDHWTTHLAEDRIIQVGYTITSLENGLLWLRSWPAGLKLNTGLGEFLGELFLWLIRFWKVVFVPLAEYTYPVIIATGWSDGIYFESVKKRECEESILAESGSYGNSPSFSESKDFMSLNSMQKRNGGLEKINGGDTSVADMCFDAYGFEQKKELATSIRSPVWNDGYGRKDLEDDDISRKAYYAGRHDWHGYGEEQRDNFTYHERSESLNYSFDGFSTGPADFEDDDIGTDLYGMENRVVEISKLTLRVG